MPTSDGNPKGLEAARRAVSLGGNLAESHVSLAVALARSEWNWSGAEDELKRAIALNPSYSMAHRIYAAHSWLNRTSPRSMATNKRGHAAGSPISA